MNDETRNWWVSIDGRREVVTVDDVRVRLDSGEYNEDTLVAPAKTGAEGPLHWGRIASWPTFVASSYGVSGPEDDITSAREVDDPESKSEVAEPSTPDSQGDVFESVAGWAVPVVIGLGVFIAFVGWDRFWWLLGWGTAIVAGLGAIALAFQASETKDDDERGEFWSAAVVCGLVALLGFWLTRPGDNAAATSVTGEDPALVATVHYWNSVPELLSANGTKFNQRSEMIRSFRNAAAAIERLPTQDVDPLAVQWGLEAAAALRDFAAVAEAIDAETLQMVGRSFFHGYSGNFAGGAADIAQTVGRTDAAAREATLRLERVWMHQRAAVGAELTQKYGVQFQ